MTALSLMALAYPAAAQRAPGALRLRHRPESAVGVTLLGGPNCSTVTSPVVHQCEDPFPGSLAGNWIMFFGSDYMTLTGKGYFLMRWEWAWFNYPRGGQYVVPTFVNQTGTFLQVAGAEYTSDDQSVAPSQEFGETRDGRVLYTPPSTYAFAYNSFPPGYPRQWQNQYYYLDGSITIHENEAFADYNLGLAPVTFDQVLADTSAPLLTNSAYVRPGISLDPVSTRPLPTAPATLAAKQAGSNVVLTWTACRGAVQGTMVEYSDGALAADGVSLMYKLAATLPGARSTWRIGRLMPAVSYSLRVKCFNENGDTAYSNAVQVTTPPAHALPSGWTASDIGINPNGAPTDPDFGYAGTSTAMGHIFQIGGSGNDIWNNADDFRFAYTRLTGDGTIMARVVDNEDTNQYAKAGVMIRETLDPASTEVMTEITAASGSEMQYRGVTSGSSFAAVGAGAAPYWIRLNRAGNVFTGSVSPDGQNWSVLNTVTVPMAATVYAGLAVTAHMTYGALAPITPYNDFNGLNTAAFDHVTVAPAP